MENGSGLSWQKSIMMESTGDSWAASLLYHLVCWRHVGSLCWGVKRLPQTSSCFGLDSQALAGDRESVFCLSGTGGGCSPPRLVLVLLVVPSRAGSLSWSTSLCQSSDSMQPFLLFYYLVDLVVLSNICGSAESSFTFVCLIFIVLFQNYSWKQITIFLYTNYNNCEVLCCTNCSNAVSTLSIELNLKMFAITFGSCSI